MQLSDEGQRLICQYVASGLFFKQAVLLAGVNYNSAKSWYDRGHGKIKDRKPLKKYRDFAEAVDKAAAESEARSVARIRRAATGDPEDTKPSKIVRKAKYVAELHCQKCQAVAREGSIRCSACGGALARVRVAISEEVREEKILGNWFADAWFLERKSPKRWGRKYNAEEEEDKKQDRLDEVLDVLKYAQTHQTDEPEPTDPEDGSANQ